MKLIEPFLSLFVDLLVNVISRSIKRIKKSDVSAFLETTEKFMQKPGEKIPITFYLRRPSPLSVFNIMMEVLAYFTLTAIFAAGFLRYLELMVNGASKTACYAALSVFILIGIYFHKGIKDRLKIPLMSTYPMILLIFISFAVYLLNV